MAKPALGRGLGALLGGNPPTKGPGVASASPGAPAVTSPPAAVPAAAPDNRDRVQRVALDRVRPSLLQPRKEFTPEALQELADSIREQGIVQPLIVRENAGFFELIAGERRWRAAQLVQLKEVPIIVREADDRTVLELALIENLQRENLNPLEEALGYAQLAEQFQLTQEQVAVKVGKSRTAVANATRLLKLPVAVREFIREGRVSVGHAKVILGLAQERDQVQAAERVIKEGLNVRQTEGLVAKFQARGTKSSGNSAGPALVPVDANITRLEDKLRDKFGTKVQLKYRQGKGSLEVSFFDDDELQRILEILGVNAD